MGIFGFASSFGKGMVSREAAYKAGIMATSTCVAGAVGYVADKFRNRDREKSEKRICDYQFETAKKTKSLF